MRFPPDARLDYQFEVDKIVTVDPRNPAFTPSGYGPHSEIAMPGFRPDSARQFNPDIPHGTVGSIWFTSSDTSIRPRQVKIYVPAGYKDLSDLPVLFVLDGFEAIDYMSYPTVLDNMIASKKIAPVLVVFIPPADRYSEFLGRLHEAFMNAICDDLVPAIDRKFKTDRNPQKRGITGISAGGHLALLTVFSRPEIFQCAAGQSPTLSNQFYETFHSFLNKRKNRTSLRIYTDVGRFDLPGGTVKDLTFYQSNEAFHLELEKAGIKHVFQAVNDGHEWANWRERTDDILSYFYH
jgi:enterochelin esterase-like enzyme